MTQPPAERRADKGLRLIVAATPEELHGEMASIGCLPAGIEIMANKGRFHLLRLQQVPAAIANIIKQECLAHGAEAAVHWRTVSCAVAESDVLIMGTVAQLRQVCQHLLRQPFGLPGTARAIDELLDRLAGTTRSPLRCGNHLLPLGEKTYLMGIINATPDSFSGDGVAGDFAAAQRQAEQMITDGADILDIGGESTRPGAAPVSQEEELQRVIPIVRALAGMGVPISVDTSKSEVASAALDAGATMLNDISGFHFDPAMAAVAAQAGVPIIIMHIKGTPREMQQQVCYNNMLAEIADYLREATAIGIAAGIPCDQLILDPGFGFGKTVAGNLEILRRLREFTASGQPLLLGTSRKSTIGHLLGGLPPEERVEGTAATVALAIANGVDIVRVHDVKAMSRVTRVADAVTRQPQFSDKSNI